MKTPVIAIAANAIQDARLIPVLGDSAILYADALIFNVMREMGATPLLVTHPDDVHRLRQNIHGIILPGSFLNSDPRHVEGSSESNESIDAKRDELDAALVDIAVKHSIPLLGICRGIQTINIAFGGGLQEVASESIHRKRESDDRSEFVHEVSIIPLSHMSAAWESEKCMLPGTHFYQVGRLGKGLTPTMIAPDGVVEAIESPTHPFLVGIQFHPEIGMQRNPIFQKILSRFLSFAKKNVT